MAYINISPNECFNTSRVIINNNNNNFDTRVNALANDYNFYLNESNILQNRVLGPNRVIQKRVIVYTDPGNLQAGLGAGRANLQAQATSQPHISIAKVFPESNVLIELAGGRWRTRTRKGLLTYFYGRTASNPYENLFGTNAVERTTFDTGGGTIYGEGQHYARALYTGNEATLDVDIYIQGASLVVNDIPELWNMASTENEPSVPFILSLTEIGT